MCEPPSATGRVRDLLSKFVNALYNAEPSPGSTTTVRMKMDVDQARFIVKSFRKKEAYVNRFMEGELRELVELRVPPLVLDKLIREKKVREKNGMIYFPKTTVGSLDTFSKDEGGERGEQPLADGEADELEDGIGKMRELLENDPMQALSELGVPDYAGSSSSGSGQLALGSGQLALAEVLRVRNLGPASVPHRFHISSASVKPRF